MAGGNGQWNQLYYDNWAAREGLDLIRGYKVEDVFTVPLKPWARTGDHCLCPVSSSYYCSSASSSFQTKLHDLRMRDRFHAIF